VRASIEEVASRLPGRCLARRGRREPRRPPGLPQHRV